MKSAIDRSVEAVLPGEVLQDVRAVERGHVGAHRPELLLDARQERVGLAEGSLGGLQGRLHLVDERGALVDERGGPREGARKGPTRCLPGRPARSSSGQRLAVERRGGRLHGLKGPLRGLGDLALPRRRAHRGPPPPPCATRRAPPPAARAARPGRAAARSGLRGAPSRRCPPEARPTAHRPRRGACAPMRTDRQLAALLPAALPWQAPRRARPSPSRTSLLRRRRESFESLGEQRERAHRDVARGSRRRRSRPRRWLPHELAHPVERPIRGRLDAAPFASVSAPRASSAFADGRLPRFAQLGEGIAQRPHLRRRVVYLAEGSPLRLRRSAARPGPTRCRCLDATTPVTVETNVELMVSSEGVRAGVGDLRRHGARLLVHVVLESWAARSRPVVMVSRSAVNVRGDDDRRRRRVPLFTCVHSASS